MKDNDAFVFNMENKYFTNNNDRALFTDKFGFSFGDYILTVTGNMLNSHNAGSCKTGKKHFYNILGEVSPLTKQKDNFTCE